MTYKIAWLVGDAHCTLQQSSLEKSHLEKDDVKQEGGASVMTGETNRLSLFSVMFVYVTGGLKITCRMWHARGYKHIWARPCPSWEKILQKRSDGKVKVGIADRDTAMLDKWQWRRNGLQQYMTFGTRDDTSGLHVRVTSHPSYKKADIGGNSEYKKLNELSKWKIHNRRNSGCREKERKRELRRHRKGKGEVLKTVQRGWREFKCETSGELLWQKWRESGREKERDGKRDSGVGWKIEREIEKAREGIKRSKHIGCKCSVPKN